MQSKDLLWGKWRQIHIDCPEFMGVECKGKWVKPAKGKCCSTCEEQEKECKDGEEDRSDPCKLRTCFDGKWETAQLTARRLLKTALVL